MTVIESPDCKYAAVGVSYGILVRYICMLTVFTLEHTSGSRKVYRSGMYILSCIPGSQAGRLSIRSVEMCWS